MTLHRDAWNLAPSASSNITILTHLNFLTVTPTFWLSPGRHWPAQAPERICGAAP